tara:strand:- start:179 stop:721 length:543 start_codon:yes stop_codon:yes gene_type:complete
MKNLLVLFVSLFICSEVNSASELDGKKLLCEQWSSLFLLDSGTDKLHNVILIDFLIDENENYADIYQIYYDRILPSYSVKPPQMIEYNIKYTTSVEDIVFDIMILNSDIGKRFCDISTCNRVFRAIKPPRFISRDTLDDVSGLKCEVIDGNIKEKVKEIFSLEKLKFDEYMKSKKSKQKI